MVSQEKELMAMIKNEYKQHFLDKLYYWLTASLMWKIYAHNLSRWEI